MGWYGELLAYARHELRKAKHHEKNTEEDLDHKVRRKLEKLGKKVSETEIKRRIARKKEMRAAWRERMEWNYKVDRLDSAVKALDHRLRALQSLGANKGREQAHMRDSV